MKHLFTSILTVVCFATYAQFPSLPYNPDENGDGLIGVVDLQGLLANYGNEFASAIVSEDGESAIVYMGQMAYPHCKRNCDELPGFWSLPEMEDLVPVWEDVYTTNDTRVTWLKSPSDDHNFRAFFSDDNSGITSQRVLNEPYPTRSYYRCYCAAKQLPRVEYTWCYNQVGDLQACAQEKVELGWIPIGGISNVYNSGASNGVGSYQVASQAFWRWAE